MDGDITGLLVYAGLVLVMVLYWTYYIKCERKEPRSEEWYDSGDGGCPILCVRRLGLQVIRESVGVSHG